MFRANAVVIVTLLVSASGWAQKQAIVTVHPAATRPTAPIARAPHVITLRPNIHPVPPPFGIPTPQRFGASPFLDPNRVLSRAIRERFFPVRPHPVVVPVAVPVPVYVYPPYGAYPYGSDGAPYNIDSQQANGEAPVQSDQYAMDQNASYKVQGQSYDQGPNDTESSAPNTLPEQQQETGTCAVIFQSAPVGADILVDGKFMGNTPSTMRLSAGDHAFTIEKSGFQNYERTVTLTAGGVISINTTLDTQ